MARPAFAGETGQISLTEVAGGDTLWAYCEKHGANSVRLGTLLRIELSDMA